jgi:hypothetical protein
VGWGLVSTSLVFGAAGALAVPEKPRDVCSRRVNDITDDAKLNYNPQTDPELRPGSSVDALDIKSIGLRLTDAALQIYMGIKAAPPASPPPTDSAYGYVTTFRQESKTFTVNYIFRNPTWNQVGQPSTNGTPTVSSSAGTTITGATAEWADNYLFVSIPLDKLQPALDEPLAEGSTFEGITGRTVQYIALKQTSADSAADPEATYVVGDDYCFGPPPAALNTLVAKAVQFGDTGTLSAKLVDEAGAALAGKTVQFAAGTVLAKSAVTNAAGVATVTFPATMPAASYPLTVRFDGDETTGKTKLTGTLVVKTEVTKFAPLAVAKPTSTTRVVTATLLDDDKHAVTGQRVDWYVNGKKVTTIATDSRGRSIFKSAKPGQSVQARFAAVPGKYAATNSTIVKV